MPDRNAFGRSLAAARREAGLSQEQLGRPRYSRSYVSLLESGGRAPTREVIEHVAERLGLPVEQVRGWAAPGDEQGAAHATMVQVEAALLLQAGQPELLLDEGDREGVLPIGDLKEYALRTDRPDVWWLAVYVAADTKHRRREFAEAHALAVTLMEHPLTQGSPLLRARAGTLLAATFRDINRRPEALEVARAAVEDARSVPDAEAVLLPALHVLAVCLGNSGHKAAGQELGPELERLARASRNPRDRLDAFVTLSYQALDQGRPEIAQRLRQEALALVEAGRALDDWTFLRIGALRMKFKGGLPFPDEDEVLEQATLGASLLPGTSYPMILTLYHVRVAAEEGRWEDSKRLAEEVLSMDMSGMAQFRPETLHRLGKAEQALGHHERAAELFRQVGELVNRGRVRYDVERGEMIPAQDQ